MRITHSRGAFLAVLTALALTATPTEAQSEKKDTTTRATVVIPDSIASLPDSLRFQTKKDFFACTRPDSLVKLVTLVANGETEAHRTMLTDTASGCFLLKPGVEVRPLKFDEYFVELRPVGMTGTIFTVLEAVERKGGGGE